MWNSRRKAVVSERFTARPAIGSREPSAKRAAVNHRTSQESNPEFVAAWPLAPFSCPQCQNPMRWRSRPAHRRWTDLRCTACDYGTALRAILSPAAQVVQKPQLLEEIDQCRTCDCEAVRCEKDGSRGLCPACLDRAAH